MLIDGDLNFVSDKKTSRNKIIDDLLRGVDENEYEDFIKNYSDDFKDKIIEIALVNSCFNFHIPKINSPVVYLSTSDDSKKYLDAISYNYEFILIESTHKNIITKDVDKISEYFK